MRKTRTLVQVAQAVLDDAGGPLWGYQLSQASGVRSGPLSRILSRMLDEGWLTDGWEDRTTVQRGRPPRRYYTVTEPGREALRALLDEARDDVRFDGLLQ